MATTELRDIVPEYYLNRKSLSINGRVFLKKKLVKLLMQKFWKRLYNVLLLISQVMSKTNLFRKQSSLMFMKTALELNIKS